jgi:hypothetical protein
LLLIGFRATECRFRLVSRALVVVVIPIVILVVVILLIVILPLYFLFIQST